jgi:oligopeptide/dipeptide ABC transporter ATP-binding protein
MVSTDRVLLKVDDLKTYFPIKKGLLRKITGYIKAVDGVSFEIQAGQTLGLVGESGCGKTTVARTIVRLIPAREGRVVFEQVDVLSADKKQLRELRRQISLIFQDPFGSLNPRMTVGNIVGEPIKVQKGITGSELTDRVAVLLSKVGLSPSHINRYPHEFSGGQRQRIGIARALSLEPRLVVCDEPVSALDVSIQSQILNLLKDLQEEFGLTYLFIAHDLAVVEFSCDVVAVMYMGRIVEKATSEELYRNPLHPYTRALMSAIPQVEPALRGKRMAFGGEVPSALNPPSGCAFSPRCPLADEYCREQMPKLEEKQGGEGHFVACWKSSGGD